MKAKIPAVNLGALQSDLDDATKALKSAQAAKAKADRAYEQALENHEVARIALNTGVTAVKSASTVPNPYAN